MRIITLTHSKNEMHHESFIIKTSIIVKCSDILMREQMGLWLEYCPSQEHWDYPSQLNCWMLIVFV